MWTHKYKYQLIASETSLPAEAQLRSKSDDYDRLYTQLIDAVRIALDETLNRMLKKAPVVVAQSKFFYADADGYHAFVEYKVLPAEKLIGYGVILCSRAELLAMEKLQEKAVTWYLPDCQDSGNMPPILPASKPLKEDEDDEEQS